MVLHYTILLAYFEFLQSIHVNFDLFQALQYKKFLDGCMISCFETTIRMNTKIILKCNWFVAKPLPKRMDTGVCAHLCWDKSLQCSGCCCNMVNAFERLVSNSIFSILKKIKWHLDSQQLTLEQKFFEEKFTNWAFLKWSTEIAMKNNLIETFKFDQKLHFCEPNRWSPTSLCLDHLIQKDRFKVKCFIDLRELSHEPFVYKMSSICSSNDQEF